MGIGFPGEFYAQNTCCIQLDACKYNVHPCMFWHNMYTFLHWHTLVYNELWWIQTALIGFKIGSHKSVLHCPRLSLTHFTSAVWCNALISRNTSFSSTIYNHPTSFIVLWSPQPHLLHYDLPFNPGGQMIAVSNTN